MDLTPKQMADFIKSGLTLDGTKPITYEDPKLDVSSTILPKIKNGNLTFRENTVEPVQPLKEILVNHKTKDVDFINFKSKHSVSP